MQNTNWWQVVRSVLASMAGVQSDANRHQDFSSNNAMPYIFVGIVAVFAFVGILVLIVSLIV